MSSFPPRSCTGRGTGWLTASVLAGIILSGCHGSDLSSVWCADRGITIDGQKGDWNGIDVYNFESERIYLGLANDATSMYLLLITPDRMLAMQALTRGLRVRFHPEKSGMILWVGCPRAAGMLRPGSNGPGDPSGDRGSRRDFNPAGSPRFAGGQGSWEADEDLQDGDDDPRGGMRGREEDGDTRGPNETMIQRALEDLPPEIEIFTRSGDDSLRLSSAEAARRGIEEKAGYEEGYLVLEMKVPLFKGADHPHAIGVPLGALDPGAKDNVAEVTFKIPKREGGESRPGEWHRQGGAGGDGEGGGWRLTQWGEPGEGPGGGGFPGRGGGPGRGGMGRGFRGSFTNGLDVTIKVRLSGGTQIKPEP